MLYERAGGTLTESMTEKLAGFKDGTRVRQALALCIGARAVAGLQFASHNV